jgi:hypothetical protein
MDRTFRAFANHGLWSVEYSHKVLKGYSLVVTPQADDAGIWYSDYHHDFVAGVTDCDWSSIVVGLDNWHLSALSHELAHAMDGCMDYNHSTWAARGILDAIDDANAVYSQPDL